MVHFTRLLHASVVLYVVFSVVYTSVTLFYCSQTGLAALRLSDLLDRTRDLSWSILDHGRTVGHGQTRTMNDSYPDAFDEMLQVPSFENMLPSDSMLHWPVSGVPSSSNGYLHGLGRKAFSLDATSAALSESLFLSKAFSSSMHPMKIFPFFYKGYQTFDDDDVTVTTLVTTNRLQVLEKLAARYQGPLSVTLHLYLHPNGSLSSLNSSILSLHSLIRSSPALAARADIHLVLSPFPRAFNTWRNIARFLARTSYILLLDVDFAMCTAWRDPVRAMLQSGGEMAKRMREGRAALVLPAFEYARARDGKDQMLFPSDKQALLEQVHSHKILPFHASWAQGHNSTDYDRFYKTQPGEIYRVARYQSAYEPYVIVRKDAGGWCDERFNGYGANKAACLFEMYLSGVSFYVLGDHFLIHQSHPYEEEARRSERKYNRKIYSDFREETCLRYIMRFLEEGVLNSTRGYNVQDECMKIKGISKVITQLLEQR